MAASHGNLRGGGGGPEMVTVVVSGYDACSFFHRASRLVSALQLLYPGRVKHEEQNFPTRDEFKVRRVFPAPVGLG